MKKFSFLIVLLLLLIGGVAAWWMHTTSALDASDKTTKTFSIKPGQGIREIANNLKADGLIRDTVAFFLVVKQQNLDGKIQAGDFYLSRSMNASAIAQALQVGTSDIRVTIPEGKRAEEVAKILQENLPSYDASWKAKLLEHEGYLFPDTYSFTKDVTIDTVIATMTDNFDKKYTEAVKDQSRKLDKKEVLILASIVEREARFAEDRPLVASVLLNRFDIDMGLYVDAPIQYILGYQPSEKTWWKRHLSKADLKIDSPYNTYLHAGLPPTPIASPGFAAIEAVAIAPDTDYVYYISDSQGHNHYAKTLKEHNANIEKYGL